MRIFVTILIVSFCLGATAQVTLDRLVFQKQFILLEDSLEKSSNMIPAQRDIYQSFLLNAFGKAEKSNASITKVLDSKISISDSIRFFLMQARLDNYIKLFDYPKALETGKKIASEYKRYLDKRAMTGLQESNSIWEVMRDKKPQTVVKKADTRLPLKRDIAGLWNVPVNVNDSTYGFVFDSGAGISVISHSFAKKLGVEIIPGFEVPVAGGLNGIMTRSKLGIAPLIHIGNIEFRDVLFLVFPDSSLSFAKGYYTINGIIGYPVIHGFSSFSISGDEIYIPKSPEEKIIKRNLVIDGLKPVMYLHFRGDILPFTFDSGADRTIFSDNFYKRYKPFIDSIGVRVKEPVGGAGGNKNMDAMNVPLLVFQHYDKEIRLTRVVVSRERLVTNGGIYYGNIGQDVIRQFEKMTISFENSYVYFE